MNREEINKLKIDIYSLLSSARESKKKEVYNRMIAFIEYAEDLRYTIKTISKIGSSHSV